jgi:thermostable 8-oxoguanine DNA glycosylase
MSNYKISRRKDKEMKQTHKENKRQNNANKKSNNKNNNLSQLSFCLPRLLQVFSETAAIVRNMGELFSLPLCVCTL